MFTNYYIVDWSEAVDNNSVFKISCVTIDQGDKNISNISFLINFLDKTID